MDGLWSNNIRKINAYVPGEQLNDKKYIKLNTNENPYKPHPVIEEAMIEAVRQGLNLYSDPTCMSLRTEVAKLYHVKTDNVFVGNGSDEVLAFSFLAFFQENDKPLLFNDITYGFYKVYGELFKVNYEMIPLDEDLKIDLNGFNKENKGIILCNPNAPTGELISLERIKSVLEANREVVVIVDEAYIDFGGESSVGLINAYDNLLVIQTFSKSRSLAGLRVGMAIGNSDLIKALEKAKYSVNPYSLDCIALAGATAAIRNNDLSLGKVDEIIENRDYLSKALQKLGFDVMASKTNFLFAKHERISGETIYLKLKEKGILIRYFNKPRINKHIRITIGTKDEIKRLLEELNGILLD